MRQVMPHRNNIVVRRTKSKIFFAGRAYRELEIRTDNAVSDSCSKCEVNLRWHAEYNHTKQSL